MGALFPEYRPSWEGEEHQALRAHAREFFAKEMTPNQEKWAEQHYVDRETWRKTAAAGLVGVDMPEEYGGQGGDAAMEMLVADELCLAKDTAFGYGVGSTITPHYIVEYGTEEQKKTWLPAIGSGEKIAAVAMTEPGAGSDLKGVRTTAKRDGDSYVINGSKTFITNGGSADTVVVVAKTDAEAGHKGISLFVVDAESEGYSVGRVLDKIGRRGADTAELFFNDLRVPAENLIGEEEGQGFYQLMKQLPRERLSIAVDSVGMAEAAILDTIAYTKERGAFGQTIFDFQNTKFELADCKSKVLAARTMADLGVQMLLDGTLDAATASMMKLHCTEVLGEVTDRCLQLFGGYGYMMEYPIAQMYAAARVARIYGGANEIMKELISRGL